MFDRLLTRDKVTFYALIGIGSNVSKGTLRVMLTGANGTYGGNMLPLPTGTHRVMVTLANGVSQSNALQLPTLRCNTLKGSYRADDSRPHRDVQELQLLPAPSKDRSGFP